MSDQIKGGLDDPEYFVNEQRQIEQIMGDAPHEGDIAFDQPPFDRGSGVWEGVVIIMRPEGADDRTMCRVASACTIEFNGARAIAPFDIPYAAVRHYFDAEDGAEVWVYGEFYTRPHGEDGHFQFFEKASQKEFFLTAGGTKVLYPSANRVV